MRMLSKEISTHSFKTINRHFHSSLYLFECTPAGFCSKKVKEDLGVVFATAVAEGHCASSLTLVEALISELYLSFQYLIVPS